MPALAAYAKDGRVVVSFKAAAKFKVRYAVGFNEWAHLEDGDMCPTAFDVTAMNAGVELTALVKQAVS